MSAQRFRAHKKAVEVMDERQDGKFTIPTGKFSVPRRSGRKIKKPTVYAAMVPWKIPGFLLGLGRSFGR